MLTDSEIERLAVELESDRVERKESSADGEKLRQAVCAFANDLPGHGLPGYVLIGVNDAGAPAGLSISDRLLLSLADIRSDGNILLLPAISISQRQLAGQPIVVLEVWPSTMPPVRYRGRVWIRAGPRRAIATAEEERRLSERSLSVAASFDRRPCPEATLDDLAVDVFRDRYLPRVVSPEILSENRRRVEDQLASLRFLDLKSGRPTHAGVLLFGRDPSAFLPGAYLQFVRFDGKDRSDRVQDQKATGGNLLSQLEQLDNLLPVQIHTARLPAAGLRHADVPDYPIVAVRELVLNGVMHRTYEGTNAPVRLSWFADRLEISSPGGLFGQVTPDNYDQVSDYRNPVLAEAMKGLGYVERFGTGIARAKTALSRNGNPPPELIFAPTHVLVTVRERSAA